MIHTQRCSTPRIEEKFWSFGTWDSRDEIMSMFDDEARATRCHFKLETFSKKQWKVFPRNSGKINSSPFNPRRRLYTHINIRMYVHVCIICTELQSYANKQTVKINSPLRSRVEKQKKKKKSGELIRSARNLDYFSYASAACCPAETDNSGRRQKLWGERLNWKSVQRWE